MASNQFAWVAEGTFTGGAGVLRRGETYNVHEFGEAIVAEWVRTGAAEYVEKKKIEAEDKPKPDKKTRKGKE